MPYNTQGRGDGSRAAPDPYRPPPRGSPSPDPYGNGGSLGTPITGAGYFDPETGTYSTPTQGKSNTTPQWDNDGRLATQDPYGWTTDFSNGVFNSPGYDERWYQEHGGDYNAPSSAEQYWNGVAGKFGAGPVAANGAQQGYDQWFNPLTQGSSFAETGAGQAPRGTNYGGISYAQRDSGPSYSEMFQGGGGQNFSNYGAKSYEGGANDTTFDSGAVFNRFFNPLSQESNSEQLYGQDPGLGAYYDRASDTGTEKIRNAMAARGLFGSGAAIDEERSLAADLGADRAKNEASYRLQAAGQSDAERRARMGLAGQLGSAADAASLGRSQNERGWVGMLDTTELGQAQEKRAGREGADTQRQARDRANLDWSSMLDNASLARSADERAWATAGDQARIARSGEARSWTDLLGGETAANNKANLDYLTAGGSLAAGADQGKYGRLADQRAGAVTAQNSLTKRYQDQFDNLMRVAQSRAGMVNNAVDAATQQKLDTVMAQLKAKLAAVSNAGSVSQQDQQEMDELFALAMQYSQSRGGSK